MTCKHASKQLCQIKHNRLVSAFLCVTWNTFAKTIEMCYVVRKIIKVPT